MGEDDTGLAVGQVAVLRADAAVRGAVIQVVPGSPESRYVLFVNGQRATYYGSQLRAEDDVPATMEVLPFAEFRARLTALEILQPSLSSLYSLHAARINYVPYQFRPVLKFIRADRPRLLIADEVGVGKTIEAGLILREFQARRDVRSVLIVCPKPLVTERKWQLEMKRFDEDFIHLDGSALRYCIRETDSDGEWPDRYAKAILPFSLFDEQMVFGGALRRRSRRPGLVDLERPPRFDLVIVDEAHHLRNTSTYVHQGVRFLVENAEAAVFLTATPIQLHSDDLFVLLNLLRPDTVIDRATFRHMAEPNPSINEAVNLARLAAPDWQARAGEALRAAGDTPWGSAVLHGSTDYRRLCTAARKESMTPEERLAFIRDAEDLHTLANLINRTRRRDIGSFTTRKPETVAVEFTEPQRELHDALLAAQARILRRTHGARAVKFLMSTIRRQAASCIYGLAPFVERILQRRMADLEWDEVYGDEEELDEDAWTTLADEITLVVQMAHNLDDTDPKRQALIGLLRDKQEMPNNKALLFSTFRHTLSYLEGHLRQAGLRVGLIHGGIPDEERVALRTRFSGAREDTNTLDMLLSSEVGCEGLDYQFCDCLVNYDLPWNPARIEQRIGRIDRYGQRSETVAIYNLVTPGTVDFDIYDRCLLRIGVFRQALGGSEEILGRITDELRSVADNLELTDAERQARLQQIGDNDIRLLQEQQKLEDDQAQLFGIVLPRQQLDEEVARASSMWLTPASLRNLVQSYLTLVCGGDGHIQGERAAKTLRLSQEARARLLDDFRRLPRQTSLLSRDWEKWLKGADQRLDITFDTVYAGENRAVVLVTPIHPLVQQAASVRGRDALPLRTAFRVVAQPGAPPGRYPFAVYQWRRHGFRDDSELQPICGGPISQETFLELLRQAAPLLMPADEFPPQPTFDELDSRHYLLWAQARSEHQDRMREIAKYRSESLGVSHRSRMALLREQLAQAENERIRRMREAQISNAEEDYARRAAEVADAEQRAEIVGQPIALGVLEVEGTSNG